MDPNKNPWMVLLIKLSRIQCPPVKAHQPFQQFMHKHYSSAVKPFVDAKLYALRAQGDFTTKNNAAFQAEVAQVEFEKLTDEEWMVFMKNAKADKEAATKKYKTPWQPYTLRLQRTDKSTLISILSDLAAYCKSL